jgi:allatostatin receptor
MSESQFPGVPSSTFRTPSPEEMEADARLELIVSIVVPIFFSLIGITGFVGNLLVIITVIFNQQMRNTTNILIFNLSLADLLFICFCIPFTVSVHFKKERENGKRISLNSA